MQLTVCRWEAYIDATTSLDKACHHNCNHNYQQKQKINNNAAINRGSLYPDIVIFMFHSKAFLTSQGRCHMGNDFPGEAYNSLL
jgi:hypothetical protein